MCACLNVTRADIVSAIRKGGARTLEDLMEKTGASSGCTACHPALCELLDRILRVSP